MFLNEIEKIVMNGDQRRQIRMIQLRQNVQFVEKFVTRTKDFVEKLFRNDIFSPRRFDRLASHRFDQDAGRLIFDEIIAQINFSPSCFRQFT